MMDGEGQDSGQFMSQNCRSIPLTDAHEAWDVGIMADEKKPALIVDGSRIEVDGEEVLVILTPFNLDLKDEEIIQQICACSWNFHMAFAKSLAGGGYRFFGNPAFEERLRAKNLSEIQWTKIPIYR